MKPQRPLKSLPAAEQFRLHAQFTERLEKVLASIRSSAHGQFAYNVGENVPRGILTPAEVVDHAIAHGAVVGLSADLCDYGIEPTVSLAVDLLENVNAHTEARALAEATKRAMPPIPAT